jgi:hypothetical protein
MPLQRDYTKYYGREALSIQECEDMITEECWMRKLNDGRDVFGALDVWMHRLCQQSLTAGTCLRAAW